jgi:hypothetical protein
LLHNRGADGKLRAIEAEAGRRFKPEMLKGLQAIAALRRGL